MNETVAVPALYAAVSVNWTVPVEGTGAEVGETVTIVVSELEAVMVKPDLLVTLTVCAVPSEIVNELGETTGAGGTGVPICWPSYATRYND